MEPGYRPSDGTMGVGQRTEFHVDRSRSSFWRGAAPPAMVRDLRERGKIDHRVEVLVRGEWRPTILFDSRCRGVDRL